MRTHPVHGILSAYPLAFFTGAFATDVIYARSANMMWANFSTWMITAGLLMGVFAAVAGIVDAVTSRGRARRTRRPWPHSVTTGLMMALGLVNAFIHSRDAWTSVVPIGLVLSAVVAVLALVSSWLGYSLEARQEAA
ncbi:DUF2231 domain-containing protein [Sphingomonas sp.]|uniref:DUF2231 domain-containing protein n=1 Tax=Sphingomonas sp. TaxID=28214 RepID=UPI003B004D8A